MGGPQLLNSNKTGGSIAAATGLSVSSGIRRDATEDAPEPRAIVTDCTTALRRGQAFFHSSKFDLFPVRIIWD
jgi:hypothetical protein